MPRRVLGGRRSSGVEDADRGLDRRRVGGGSLRRPPLAWRCCCHPSRGDGTCREGGPCGCRLWRPSWGNRGATGRVEARDDIARRDRGQGPSTRARRRRRNARACLVRAWPSVGHSSPIMATARTRRRRLRLVPRLARVSIRSSASLRGPRELGCPMRRSARDNECAFDNAPTPDAHKAGGKT